MAEAVTESACCDLWMRVRDCAVGLEFVLVGRIQIRPGQEVAFADWQYRHTAALSKRPGFLSCDVEPPGASSPSKVWTLAANFASEAALEAWRDSDDWSKLRNEIRGIASNQGFEETVTQVPPGQAAGGMVTEVIFSRVRAGMEDSYRDWAARIQVEQHGFAGYRGTYRQQPSDLKSGAPWVTILRFDSIQDLEAWKGSDARKRLIDEARAYVETEEHLRLTTAFPGWVPTDPATGKSPPNWKTGFLVLIGLYPVVAMSMKFISPLWEQIALEKTFSVLISSGIGVTVTSLLSMPVLVKRFRWWLFPNGHPQRTTLLGVAILLGILAAELVFVHFVLFGSR